MIYLSKELRNEVAILKLDRGTTNALNPQFIQALSEELLKVKGDPEVKGIVLGSANDKFFSIGFDIPELYELSRSDFSEFYHAFNRLCLNLYSFPKPTVAAITGHAIAGGCILTLCCDYRFIADGRKLMGLNEIKLGVPVPYPADRILRQMIGDRFARDVIESGEFYNPQEVLRMGMVDGVLPLDEVLPRSIERANALGNHPQEAYEIIKMNRVEILVAEIKAHLREKEKNFIDLWYRAESRSLLKEAIKKF